MTQPKYYLAALQYQTGYIATCQVHFSSTINLTCTLEDTKPIPKYMHPMRPQLQAYRCLQLQTEQRSRARQGPLTTEIVSYSSGFMQQQPAHDHTIQQLHPTPQINPTHPGKDAQIIQPTAVRNASSLQSCNSQQRPCQHSI